VPRRAAELDDAIANIVRAASVHAHRLRPAWSIVANVPIGTSDASASDMSFQRILCPTDFSTNSREALRVAIDLARGPNASIVIVHVSEFGSWTTAQYRLAPDVMQDMIDAQEAELAKWKGIARELGAKEVTAVMLSGTPWDQIVSAARENAIDLIVMGTHGRTGLKHVLVGSVTEKVVRHAPCAVLVVRPKEGT
jgi:nucleotide-binding universal stress UspA family protein